MTKGILPSPGSLSNKYFSQLMKVIIIILCFFVSLAKVSTASEIKSPLSAWSAIYLVIKSEKNSIKCYEIFRKFDFKGNEDHFIKGIESWAVTSKNKYWIYSIKVNNDLQIIASNSKALEKNEASLLEDALLKLEKLSELQIPNVHAE